MKLVFQNKKQRRDGLATIIVLALLVMMSFLFVSTTRSLQQLRREMQLLEQKQIKRLEFRVAPPPANPQVLPRP